MTPMPEPTPRVGRWLPGDPDNWWECDGSAPARCVRLHGPSVSACGACGTKRPPLPETPAPRVDALPPHEPDHGRTGHPKLWCERCRLEAQAADDAPTTALANVAAPASHLPPPSPRFLTDAQVVGRERVAGVDGAYEAFRERVRWFYRNAPECQEARKHSFGRQADVAFTLAMNEALAALRAVPVEGRPLAAAITDHPVSVEDAVKLLREAEQELSGGEGNHEILGAECGVMADRLAALVTPTPSEDRPDGE